MVNAGMFFDVHRYAGFGLASVLGEHEASGTHLPAVVASADSQFIGH